MNGITNAQLNQLNQIYAAARGKTEGFVGVDDKAPAEPSSVGGKKNGVVRQFTVRDQAKNEDVLVRQTILEALDLASKSGDTPMLKKIRKELIGKDGADREKPVPPPLAQRAIQAIRSQAKNVDVLIDRAVTVAKVPPAARKILQEVIGKYPDNRHVADFMDAYSNGRIDLTSFRCVCRLASETTLGDSLGRAYLRGFAGDVKVEERLTNPEVDMEKLGERHRIAQVKENEKVLGFAGAKQAIDEGMPVDDGKGKALKKNETGKIDLPRNFKDELGKPDASVPLTKTFNRMQKPDVSDDLLGKPNQVEKNAAKKKTDQSSGVENVKKEDAKNADEVGAESVDAPNGKKYKVVKDDLVKGRIDVSGEVSVPVWRTPYEEAIKRLSKPEEGFMLIDKMWEDVQKHVDAVKTSDGKVAFDDGLHKAALDLGKQIINKLVKKRGTNEGPLFPPELVKDKPTKDDVGYRHLKAVWQAKGLTAEQAGKVADVYLSMPKGLRDAMSNPQTCEKGINAWAANLVDYAAKELGLLPNKALWLPVDSTGNVNELYQMSDDDLMKRAQQKPGQDEKTSSSIQKLVETLADKVGLPDEGGVEGGDVGKNTKQVRKDDSDLSSPEGIDTETGTILFGETKERIWVIDGEDENGEVRDPNGNLNQKYAERSETLKSEQDVYNFLSDMWKDVSDSITPEEDPEDLRDNFEFFADLSIAAVGKLIEDTRPATLFANAVVGGDLPSDEDAGVKAYAASLDDNSLNSEQKQQRIEIFRRLPPSMRGLMTDEGKAASGVRTWMDQIVSAVAEKLGASPQGGVQVTVENDPSRWTAGFDASNGETLAVEKKIESKFVSNTTSKYPKGVGEAAVVLWVGRHMKYKNENPAPMSNLRPENLLPSTCETVQEIIDGVDTRKHVDIFSDVKFVKDRTGGILQEASQKRVLRAGDKTNPELANILGGLPKDGFAFISASKGEASGQAMAVFKESDEVCHFFDPNRGMFTGTPGEIAQIVGHCLGGFTEASMIAGAKQAVE